VEKILSGNESLPDQWPVHGTTGYDFLNHLNGLFVNPASETAFNELYQQFTGCNRSFKDLAYEGKRQILQTALVSELRALALHLKRIAASTRSGQDLTFRQLHSCLLEVISSFPVYRTYITEDTEAVSQRDRHYIEESLERARQRNPPVDQAPFEFVRSILLLEGPEDFERPAEAREFVMKFQQLTGPVTAKGVEDTAFYNYNRLVSLNEVGGDPDRFGYSVEEFHRYNQRQAAHWPYSLLATATHDTKRGEDLRARLNVLSEMPEQWSRTVNRWSKFNADKKRVLNGHPAPSANDEYLFYQTLTGAWLPEAETSEGLAGLRDRISAYMLKATKEAKAHTSWIEPNSQYESSVKEFVERTLQPENPFLSDFKDFQQLVSFFGVLNSLSQTILKLTSPGVPDIYQGTELWDFNLVDPDNRRPVDYDLRRRLLEDLKEGCRGPEANRNQLGHKLLHESHTGQIKLYLIWRVLEFRRRHSDLFEYGDYVPLPISGSRKHHVCAFARVLGNDAAIIIAPRLVFSLTAGSEQPPLGEQIWKDTALRLPNELQIGRYKNALTGAVLSSKEDSDGMILRVCDALTTFPVALIQPTPLL